MKFCKTIKEFAIITVGTSIVAAAVFFFMLQAMFLWAVELLWQWF